MKKTFLALFVFAALYLSAQNDKKIVSMFPGIYKVSMGKIDPITPFSLCESLPKTKELNATGSGKDYIRPEQVRIEINQRGCLVEIPLKGDEQLYGFGLQIGSFMQKGLKKKPIVNDNPLNNLGYSHAPQTFYVSNKGYGIIINTSRYTTFYGGSLQLNEKAETNDEKSDKKIATTTEDLYSTQSSGGNMQVDIPGAAGIEVFVICGKNIKEVIEKYNLMSGGGALPPMWGLGVKYRMKGDSNEEAVSKMASYFRDKKIPCDVLGLEPGWQTAAYSCSYVWEKKRFPDPESMIKNLSKQSFHVNFHRA